MGVAKGGVAKRGAGVMDLGAGLMDKGDLEWAWLNKWAGITGGGAGG